MFRFFVQPFSDGNFIKRASVSSINRSQRPRYIQHFIRSEQSFNPLVLTVTSLPPQCIGNHGDQINPSCIPPFHQGAQLRPGNLFNYASPLKKMTAALIAARSSLPWTLVMTVSPFVMGQGPFNRSINQGPNRFERPCHVLVAP